VLRLVVALPAVAATLALAVAGAGASPGADRFPVTVTAANGKVTIAKRPVRVVSLSPTATETLFAIGAGRQVVAVDDQSDYPSRAPRTRLSGFTPNAEAIATYRPDLVVVQFDANRIVAALRRLRIPVVVQPPARTLADTYAQIRQLGVVTGHGLQARSLVARMRTRVAQLVAATRRRAAGRAVYHEISPDYYSATSSTFIGSIYRLLGVANIADAADRTGSGYPQLSAEYILAANPDLIVLADIRCCGQTKATVAARPGWSRIRAVTTGAIVLIDDSIASRWGPRVVNFVRALARAFATLPRA
jgi:iron complex transport system substrate-binding protein